MLREGMRKHSVGRRRSAARQEEGGKGGEDGKRRSGGAEAERAPVGRLQGRDVYKRKVPRDTFVTEDFH